MLRVIAVKPLDGYKLYIEFSDRVVRVIDCSFLLHGTLGEPLKDLDYFRRVRVDDDARTIVWPNGLDPGTRASPRRAGINRRLQAASDGRVEPVP